MRSNEEFKEELFRRRETVLKKRKHRRAHMLIAGISLVLCVAILAVFVSTPVWVQAADLMEGITPQAVEERPTGDAFLSAQMDFSLKLFQACIEENGVDNTLVSPLSVSLALSMAANGAEGQTRQEMEAVLTNGSIEDWNGYLKYYVNHLPAAKDTTLSIANSIWYREDVQVVPEFLQTNADYYGADVYSAPFNDATLQDINTWVNQHTDGMIPNALDQIDPYEIMYLINTLVFDGKWQNPYKPEEIRDGIFTAQDGTLRTVDMMYSDESRYLDDGSARGFIKDYEDGAYHFVALLPNEGISLEDYIVSLTGDGLAALLENPQEVQVNAGLPQFQYDDSMELKDILSQLGMPSAFSPYTADFSNMAEGEIYIGRVLHKTRIILDANGTKAAAATIVAPAFGGTLVETHTVILDRPFVYLIVDGQTNLPIFIGTVTDIP